MTMPHCFAIQPFDGGPYDRRYDDVLAPAIKKAQLEAYRVDRDPSATIPIESIENGIRGAAACLADISTDNPNVWFELGFAFACGKPVVLICSTSRQTRFPFDIQHRHVIKYSTESSSDFERLESEIVERLKTNLAKEEQIRTIAEAGLKKTEGLTPYEIAALIIVAQSDLDPDSYPSVGGLKHDMSRAGFNSLATVVAVKSLIADSLIEATTVNPFNGDSYTGYCLSSAGTSWLMENRNALELTTDRPKKVTKLADDFEDFPGTLADEDDDLPF